MFIFFSTKDITPSFIESVRKCLHLGRNRLGLPATNNAFTKELKAHRLSTDVPKDGRTNSTGCKGNLSKLRVQPLYWKITDWVRRTLPTKHHEVRPASPNLSHAVAPSSSSGAPLSCKSALLVTSRVCLQRPRHFLSSRSPTEPLRKERERERVEIPHSTLGQ